MLAVLDSVGSRLWRGILMADPILLMDSESLWRDQYKLGHKKGRLITGGGGLPGFCDSHAGTCGIFARSGVNVNHALT